MLTGLVDHRLTRDGCAGVLVLRVRDPRAPRPFRVPFVPLVPLAGVAACGYLMLGLPADTWARLLVWMALGVAIYFGYGRHHARLARAD